jgi:predicted nucleotidyltransferase
MIETRIKDSLVRLDADLRDLAVSWALVGGLAVSVRAEPRMTRDIDIAVVVRNDSEAEELVRRLMNRGYVIHALVEHEEAARLATVRLLRRGDEEGIVIDLLLASSGIEAEVVAAADLVDVLPDVAVPLATTGHLLALKVLALRPDRVHERPQDFIDIRELLRVAGEADLTIAGRALELISERGYHRGKDLKAELEEQRKHFAPSASKSG